MTLRILLLLIIVMILVISLKIENSCDKTIIGCYEKSFTYVDGQTNTKLPISQIQSLIELSEYCEQTFYYECTLAPLTVSHTDEDIDYAFWEDRHGNINNYFTGKMVRN